MSIKTFGVKPAMFYEDPEGAWVREEDHAAEVARLRADLAAARAALLPCRNLLALMNGDGGHRQHEVGIEQAAREAEDKYTRMANALAATAPPEQEGTE